MVGGDYYNDSWRGRQLRSIRICAGYPCDTFGSSQRLDRCRPWCLFSEGGPGNAWEAWLCNVPYRFGDYSTPCAAGQGDQKSGRDSTICYQTRYACVPALLWDCDKLNFITVLGFLIYCIAVSVFSIVMIYRIAPKYGKDNPLIYISICSTVGSVSVMSVKAFGIALKLTFNGENQFTYPSTYAFMIVTVVCILTQMNYFNKALSQFPTSM